MSTPAAATPHPEWKRNITLFLASQTISLFGSALVQYAIIWHITLTSQSGTAMTGAIVASFLPTFFVSPFAGVWADRYDRKRLIILADALIALTTLGIALYYLAGNEGLWPLIVASAARGLGSGIQTPAVNAYIPQLVPPEALTRVNSINGSVQSTMMIVSPMASGALLSLAPLSTLFFIDVVTAIIAIGMLALFLRVPPHARALDASATGYVEDMKAGVSYIAGHSYVRSFFVFCAVFFFMAAPVAFLSPLQVTRTFGSDVWRLTAIELAFFIGMTLGGALMGTWGGLRNRVRTMAVGSLVAGAATLLLGIVPSFWPYLLLMGLVGIAMPMFNVPSMVLLQTNVEASMQGRVFGVLTMISSVMMPLGMAVFGPLADVVRIEWLLVGTGAIMALQSLMLVGNRALLAAGEPPVVPAEEAAP